MLLGRFIFLSFARMFVWFCALSVLKLKNAQKSGSTLSKGVKLFFSAVDLQIMHCSVFCSKMYSLINLLLRSWSSFFEFLKECFVLYLRICNVIHAAKTEKLCTLTAYHFVVYESLFLWKYSCYLEKLQSASGDCSYFKVLLFLSGKSSHTFRVHFCELGGRLSKKVF